MATIVGRAINRNTYLEMTTRFSAKFASHTLLVNGLSDARYKELIDDMFAGNQIDISYTPAGQRLCALVRTNRLLPLQAQWQLHQLSKSYDQRIHQAVQCGENEYGFPLLFYYWGFFYKKSVFDALNIEPPKTWTDFIHVVKVLRENQKIPVLLGSKNHWPAVSWMSYVNLRLHGIVFHRDLANGRISFTGEKFRKTL